MSGETKALAIEPAWYRRVLGQYPTGVCVVTAAGPAGSPIAMVVGSFTSVSLDPPLVAFLPARSSATWKELSACRRLCINVLSSSQEKLCRQIAGKDPQWLAGQILADGANGAPRLAGSLAAIECDIEQIVAAGDHDIVLCRVTALELGAGETALIFFRGGYGRFATRSIVAADPVGVMGAQIALAQRMRPLLERGASDIGASCLLTSRIDTEIVVLAEAEAAHAKGRAAALVGQRLPYMPPTGNVFAAWADERELAEWLARMPDDARRPETLRKLLRVRERGASLGLASGQQRAFLGELASAAAAPPAGPERFEKRVAELNYDPDRDLEEYWRDVRQISVPVGPTDARMPVALTIHSWPTTNGPDHVERLIRSARNLAAELEQLIG